MTLNKYLRTGAAALGALAVASAANAADMYSGGMKEAPVYVPPPTWTGFYLGGHIGAAWESVGNQNNLFNDDCMGWGIWSGGDSCGKNGTYTAGTAWTYSSAAINERRESSGDAFGGVQFGYNFQTYGAFVWGLEVDLGGMALNGNGNGNGNTLWTDGWGHTHSTPMNFSEDNQGGFYGDVTGRLGYTWGPAMLYVKGGFAFLDADLNMDEFIMDTVLAGVMSWHRRVVRLQVTTATTRLTATPLAAVWNGRSAPSGRSRWSICTSTSATSTTIAATTGSRNKAGA